MRTLGFVAAASAILAGAAAPLAAKPAAGIPAAVVTFRPSAEVRGKAIRLADVALIESLDSRLSTRLEGVEVGTAPLCGHSRTVSAEYAQIRVRQIGIDVSRLLFRGAELITVNRPEQVLAGGEILTAARAAALAANPGAEAEIPFVPRDLRLPVGSLVLKALPVKTAGQSSGCVTIQVLVNGEVAALVPVSFHLLHRAPMLVAVRDLTPGTVLTRDDVRVEERPELPGRLVLSDVAQAVGQQAVAPIKAGTLVMGAQLKPAVLIKRGTRIRLICSGPSFVATTAGEALQDGAAGQPIRVRNLSSLQELTALVRDDQTAEVPF